MLLLVIGHVLYGEPLVLVGALGFACMACSCSVSCCALGLTSRTTTTDCDQI